MTAWQDNAACRGMDPELFFPDIGHSMNAIRAKRVCATCPVADHCLEYALTSGERFGIWGGVGEPERKRLRRLRSLGVDTRDPSALLPPPRQLEKRPSRRSSTAPCGTYAGYKRHKNWDEPPCDECRAANARTARGWALNRRSTA